MEHAHIWMTSTSTWSEPDSRCMMFTSSHIPLSPSLVLMIDSSDSSFLTKMSSSDSEGVLSPSSMESSCLPPFPSTTDNYAYLSPITPILRLARNLSDPIGFMSNNSSLPPPFPTLSAQSFSLVCWATSTALYDNNLEEHGGSSFLYLASPSYGHWQKESTGTVSNVGSSL